MGLLSTTVRKASRKIMLALSLPDFHGKERLSEEVMDAKTSSNHVQRDKVALSARSFIISKPSHGNNKQPQET
jgi:hypothetical protein